MLEDVLRGLEEATQFAKSFRFELTDHYLDLIERVEALPQNRSGAHKSGRSAGLFRGHRIASPSPYRELDTGHGPRQGQAFLATHRDAFEQQLMKKE